MIRKIMAVYKWSTVQKHFVYILQLAVHTVQMNWISRLGRYLMTAVVHQSETCFI